MLLHFRSHIYLAETSWCVQNSLELFLTLPLSPPHKNPPPQHTHTHICWEGYGLTNSLLGLFVGVSNAGNMEAGNHGIASNRQFKIQHSTKFTSFPSDIYDNTM